MLLDASTDSFHDLEINAQQVIAAHAGLARNACGDDYDIRTGNSRIITRARDFGIETFNRRGLCNIECFALGYAISNIE